ADERGGGAGRKGEVDIANRDDLAVAPGHAGPVRDRFHQWFRPRSIAPAPALPHGFAGAGRAGGGGMRAGRISGALSAMPPGWMAGKRACAQRIAPTAGLFARSLAAGSVQRMSSITPLGR